MSNNNTRNIYNPVGHATDVNEMERLLNTSQQLIGNNQMTTINIENDMAPGTSQQHLQRQQQMRREVDTTRINMETNVNQQTVNGGESANIDDRQRMPNLFAMLREARHQLNRSQSLRDPHAFPNAENISANTHSRSWRENLYDVLSSPVSPRAHTQVLRAIFTSSSAATVRYDSLHPDDQLQFMLNHQITSQPEGESISSSRSPHSNGIETQSATALRLASHSSRLSDERSLNDYSTSEPQTPVVDNNVAINGNNRRQSSASNSAPNGGRLPQRQTSVAGSTTAPTVDMIDDADTNALGEIIVKLVTHFFRYLPFIFIILVKFIHDHLLGILDILVLQAVMYQINKTLIEQVAKLNHKSLVILVLDLIVGVCVVTYRFILSTSNPDPFGLLINPPVLLDMSSTLKTESTLLPFEVPSSATTNSLNSTIPAPQALSLGTLLYYVAVNDLILKLMTQFIKIIITMFPIKVIRHKSRARLYALIENVSQFYRVLVPIRQWLRYLFESYTGLEVISGILFSSFYTCAKLFELFERGKPLQKSIINFVRNMDHDRKPTKDELEAAGTVCPICHDSYSSPVVLECGHIFCDECVNTWFKREQTCPMCRAKVSEDPTWQDGATTYFYQLC